MKLITGNDPVRDRQAIAGMHIVIFAVIAGGVWMAFKEQWWVVLLCIAAALLLVAVCIDAQRQMNAAYRSVDIRKLYMKGWVVFGPDWLFWSIVILWFVAAGIGSIYSGFALMYCALILRANRKRLYNALNRFFPFSKIRNIMVRRFVFALPDILYSTLSVCAVAVLLIASILGHRITFNFRSTICFSACGLLIVLSMVDSRFYKNRKPPRQRELSK